MSTIHNALEKTQQDLLSLQTPQKKSPKKNTGLLICIIALSISIITTIFMFLFKDKIFPLKSFITSKKNHSKKTKLSSLKKQNPLKINDIHLNGILKMDGSYMALINDNVYTTGNSIEGLLIESIQDTSITLKQNGQTVTINVNH